MPTEKGGLMDETTLVKSYKSSRMFWMDEIGQGGQLLETLHCQTAKYLNLDKNTIKVYFLYHAI